MSFWIGGKHTVTEALNNPQRIIKEVAVLDERSREFLINNTKLKNIKINNQKFFNKICFVNYVHFTYSFLFSLNNEILLLPYFKYNNKNINYK